MALSQARPRRKLSGARYKDYRKKKQYELGRDPSLTKLGAKRIHTVRTMGNSRKFRILSSNIANLFDPKSKSFKQVKISTTTENPANRHFVRRNIMTKGSVINTELGKARVTSRPGQDGVINAVLIS
ncbi:30S ribosomal protein S8e [Candidatus Woesearchaeota archaeon]|jgi:small subunit ribosomal protein S8e|nr:30S ribosomal protein S8e [Candidatus Woesearchaeota archaeon]|tara:strand:+ start:18500 stop:18880 length:381 start_codon:yes stop_codon:yes gene_type:complete